MSRRDASGSWVHHIGRLTQRRTVAKACSTFVESGGLSPQRRPRAYWICRRASAESVGRRFIPNRIGRVLLPSPLRVCQKRKEKKRKKGGISVARPCLATVALACVSEKGDQRRAAGGDLVGARNFHCRILNQLRLQLYARRAASIARLSRARD